MQVLSRSILCDGREYPEGTPVDDLPLANRASVSQSGYTREAPALEAAPQTAADVDPEDSPAVETADETGEQTKPPAKSTKPPAKSRK